MTSVFSRALDLPSDFSVNDLPKIPYPQTVLLCPPEYFEIIDVKNPFMHDQIGRVNHAAAQHQWQELKAAYDRIGIRVETLIPLPGCEDMVFCANPVFVGVNSEGRRLCVPSTMKYASRQREVGPAVEWFKSNGYEFQNANPDNLYFEGGGDAIWHPGRALIWGGLATEAILVFTRSLLSASVFR